MGATFCYIAAYSRRTFKSKYFNVLSLKSWPSCRCGVCTCLDTDNKVCGAFVATFLRFLAANATTTADASAESVALQKASKCPKMSKVKSSQGMSRPNCWDHFRIVIGCYWQHWLFWRVATAQCGCDELSDAAYDVFKPWGTSRYKSFIGHAETALHLDTNFMSLGQSRRRKQSHHLSLAAETCKYINNIL